MVEPFLKFDNVAVFQGFVIASKVSLSLLGMTKFRIMPFIEYFHIRKVEQSIDFSNIQPLSPHLSDSPLSPTTPKHKIFPIEEEMEAT